MSLSWPEQVRGRHVLIGLLGFFGIIVAVNAVFVFVALTSFNGVDTENAYTKGLRYNETLAAIERQEALGWQAQWSYDVEAPNGVQIRVRFADAQGYALRGLTVNAEVRRPVQQGFDQTVTLAELGDGLYGARVDLPLEGQWDIRLQALDGSENSFVLERRLWLK